MSDKRDKPLSPYEIHLRDREAKLSAELTAIRLELEQITTLKSQSVFQAPSLSTSPPKSEVDLSRLKLIDAILEHLRSVRQPQSPSQIWSALSAAGVEVQSDTPNKSVTWALRELLKKRNPEVIQVSFGKWDLLENYTDTRLREISKMHGGLGGKSRKVHSKRTKDAIERYRANGGRMGAPRKFTAEKVVDLKKALSEQDISVVAACARVGISPALFYQNRKKIEAWREGMPWPPQQKEDDDQRSPQLRVIK